MLCCCCQWASLGTSQEAAFPSRLPAAFQTFSSFRETFPEVSGYCYCVDSLGRELADTGECLPTPQLHRVNSQAKGQIISIRLQFRLTSKCILANTQTSWYDFHNILSLKVNPFFGNSSQQQTESTLPSLRCWNRIFASHPLSILEGWILFSVQWPMWRNIKKTWKLNYFLLALMIFSCFLIGSGYLSGILVVDGRFYGAKFYFPM